MTISIANIPNNKTAGAKSKPIVLGNKDLILEYIGSITFLIDIQICETIWFLWSKIPNWISKERITSIITRNVIIFSKADIIWINDVICILVLIK